MRFIDPKTNFAFKKIFGSPECKEILISFLSAIAFADDRAIQDLEIIEPYPAGGISLKDSHLDARATLVDETNVIIEVQMLNIVGLDKRVFYNAAKTYAHQFKDNRSFDRLKPVISLNVSDFTLFEERDRVISRFVLKEREALFDYTQESIELIFVELPNFHKKQEELESLADRWIFFLQNAASLESIPEIEDTPEIVRAFELASYDNLSDAEQTYLERQEMWLRDRKSVVRQGLQEGRKQGLKEGRKQGLEKGRQEGLEKGHQEGLEKGLQQGVEYGRRAGQIELLLKMMEANIGEIPLELRNYLSDLSPEQLESLALESPKFRRESDLRSWLDRLARD